MRKIFILSGLMAGVLSCMTSCLNSDEAELTMYEDVAVTSFYITSADVEYHTLSSKGEDSTYIKANTDVKNIKFKIDHYQGKIYNVDSLPYGTNAQKLLCSYNTKNNGTLGLKALKENEDGTTASGTSEDDYVWKYVSTTDSIDFSYPRTVRVYAYTDHEAYREYTITVNVKQSNDKSNVWVKSDAMTVPQWVTDDASVGYGQEMAQLNGGKVVYTNADGTQETNGATNVKQLLAMNPVELYAVDSDDKLIVSRDHGATWSVDATDNNAFDARVALASISVARKEHKDVYHTVMFADPQLDCENPQLDTWMKTIDGNDGGKWICLYAIDKNIYNMPLLQNVTVAASNSSIYYATGKDNGMYLDIYVSRDGGLTWKKDANYAMPTLLKGAQWLKLYAVGEQLVAVSDNGTWVMNL